MINPYTRVISWSRQLRQLGLAALLLGGATTAHAQQSFNYSPGQAQNVAGTYTGLGAGGTVITTSNTDDANSTAQNIGFTFAYNGQQFTQFVLNTNGLVRLGSAPPSAANMFANYVNGQAPGVPPIESTGNADTNLLIPFDFDLESGTRAGGAEYRVATTGTSPNQVCTIQWKNVRDKADSTTAAQYASFNFQVKLYQTTNVIEFVYDAAMPTTTGAETARFPTVGIKGDGSDSRQDVLAYKSTSGATWDKTVFITGKYTNGTHNFRRTVGPDAGRTYRFTPLLVPANDAAVLALYTLAKLPIPLGTPHVVQAAIANYGSAPLTNLVVKLTVTGANPFTTSVTIATAQPGDILLISFPGFTPQVLGDNTLTVTVPNDADNTNNSSTRPQSVATNTFGYIRPNEAPVTAVGNDKPGGLFTAGFTASAALPVNTVSVFLTDPNSVGKVVFGVVTDTTTKAILGRSADYTVVAADINTLKTFTITTPPTVAAGKFFLAGLGQAAYTGAKYFPVGVQAEQPTRPNAFFSQPVAGGQAYDLSYLNFGSLMIDITAGSPPTCLPPTAATFSATTGTSVQVTFTGGPASPAGYTLVYGPVGFDPTSAGTTITSATLPVTLTGLVPNTIYQVFVRTSCSATNQSAFSGPYQFQTGCAPNTVITAFPYSETFDNLIPGQALPCGIATLDANADGVTWAISKTTPNSAPNALRYSGVTLNNVAANDWFFTPALTTTANTRYQVAFRYRGEGIVNSPSRYVEKLEVKVGPSATAAGQTTTLFTNTNITNTSYALANTTSTPAVAVFTPGAGTQYVGFHVYSDANQGNLYIDDLSITAASVTATTSAVLLQAVTVFPNPSTTGVFDLEIHGANAKGSLGVLVTNTLGQQVYTGVARDNTTNRLDLSGLTPGLYHLTVRNGEETLTRQLAIVD